MVVSNPQLSRRSFAVVGPAEGVVEAVTGLLVTCHYFYRRPGRGVQSVAWRAERPDLVTAVAQPAVASAIAQAAARDASIDSLIDELRPILETGTNGLLTGPTDR